MKKTAALFIPLLFWVLPLHPQVLPNPAALAQSDKEVSKAYLQKTKHQKAIGLALLIAGIGVASVGASTMELDTPGANAYIYLGNFVALGSIPFFVSAAKNKDRAELVLRRDPLPLAAARYKTTSLGISIPLNK